MRKSNVTYLFCLDEHRNFPEDIKKRFSDSSKYRIIPSSSHMDFLRHFSEEKEHRNCKVAILAIYEAREQSLLTENLTREIKRTDPKTGVVLVYPAEKTEEIKKAIKFNIDTFIPRNDNMILRLHNAVKKLISEHNLEICRRRRNFSLYVLLAFLSLSGILILVTYFKFPAYF